MKNSQQLWENYLYVCVNLVREIYIQIKCLFDFFFYRKETDEVDTEDKICKENLKFGFK